MADIPARQCTVHGLAAGLAPFEMDFDKAHVDTFGPVCLLVVLSFSFCDFQSIRFLLSTVPHTLEKWKKQMIDKNIVSKA